MWTQNSNPMAMYPHFKARMIQRLWRNSWQHRTLWSMVKQFKEQFVTYDAINAMSIEDLKGRLTSVLENKEFICLLRWEKNILK